MVNPRASEGPGGHGLNKLMLIGVIGREPEMRYTAHGVPVTTFSIATARTWVSSEGERRQAVDWFNLVAWRHLAEVCYECLGKDMLVYVEGRLQTRAWDDEGGHHRYETEVVVQDVIPLGNAGETTTLPTVFDEGPASPGGLGSGDESLGVGPTVEQQAAEQADEQQAAEQADEQQAAEQADEQHKDDSTAGDRPAATE